MKKRNWLFAILISCCLAASIASASVTTYVIEDIGEWGASYTTDNASSLIFTGTGFVGMYSDDSFAHLLGIEGATTSRTAMQLDITALAGAEINSARLEFDLLNYNGWTVRTQNTTITSFTANGTLGYYWDAPDTLGSLIFPTTNNSDRMSLDITSLLTERVNSGSDWLGLHLQGSTTAQWTYTWDSSCNQKVPDGAQVRLIVDSVPEPATVVLLALGAGMILKKKK